MRLRLECSAVGSLCEYKSWTPGKTTECLLKFLCSPSLLWKYGLSSLPHERWHPNRCLYHRDLCRVQGMMQVDVDQGLSLCSTHTGPDLAEWLSFSTWHHVAQLSLEQKLEVIDQTQFELLYDTKEAGCQWTCCLEGRCFFHLQIFIFCCFQLIIHNLKILLCGENELSALTFHAKMNCMKNLAFMSIYF